MQTKMPNLFRRSLTINLISSVLLNGKSIGGKSFSIFDALLHKGKPNLQRIGLRSIRGVENIWRKGRSTMEVDEIGVKESLKWISNDNSNYFFDIERWLVLDTTPEMRKESIAKLRRVAEIARNYSPNAKFGFYGIPPASTYWRTQDAGGGQYTEWLDVNRELLALASMVDFILPSLYTFYDDPIGWRRYAVATIREARLYSKPVYPFLWFEYHDSNKLLAGKEITESSWHEELSFCHECCDGIVLWGGFNRGWTERAKWWQAVRSEFDLR